MGRPGWYYGGHPPACTCVGCNEGGGRSRSTATATSGGGSGRRPRATATHENEGGGGRWTWIVVVIAVIAVLAAIGRKEESDLPGKPMPAPTVAALTTESPTSSPRITHLHVPTRADKTIPVAKSKTIPKSSRPAPPLPTVAPTTALPAASLPAISPTPLVLPVVAHELETQSTVRLQAAELETLIYELINVERTSRSLQALERDIDIHQFARSQIESMAHGGSISGYECAKTDRFHHTSSLTVTGTLLYSSISYRNGELTYTWKTAEEIASEIATGWMDNYQDTDDQYVKAGVGVGVSEDGQYLNVVLNFC